MHMYVCGVGQTPVTNGPIPIGQDLGVIISKTLSWSR